jgi:hypothetical protein
MEQLFSKESICNDNILEIKQLQDDCRDRFSEKFKAYPIQIIIENIVHFPIFKIFYIYFLK